MQINDNAPNQLSPALTYARHLRELHDLIERGLGESIEAEDLADHMDAPWYAMTDSEQKRMKGLSADLYALREGGPKRIEMTAEEEGKWRQAAKEPFHMYRTGDVDAALEFLRLPIPTVIPTHSIPYLQAMAWERLGDLETALVFMKEAEQTEPENALSVMTLLHQLEKVDEAAKYAEKVISRENATPEELYSAVVVLAPCPEAPRDDEWASKIRRIIDILNRASTKFENLRPAERDVPNLDAMIAYTLGLCYENLGAKAEALKIYSAALSRNPRDAEILVARGLTYYPQNVRAALTDFQAATRAGTSSIWPWHILARHALENGVYGDALRLAIRASECPGPTQIRAEAFEAIAISQAMLGQPHAWVLENFANAVKLDPNNERILQNRDIASAQESLSLPTRRWKKMLGSTGDCTALIRSDQAKKLSRQAEAVAEHRGIMNSNYLLTA